MMNLLKAEFYKLFHSRSFWGMLLFSFSLSSLLLLDSNNRTSNLLFASLYNMPLLYFLTIIFGAVFIGNDFGERTLHCYISAGYRRGSILFIKVLTYQIACVVILTLPLVVHGLIGMFLQKEIPVSMEKGFIIGMTILVSILAMCMLPLFFSFIFRDVGKSLVVPMVLFFLAIFLLNADHTQQISILLPMGQLRLISLQQLPKPAVTIVAIDVLWLFILYIGAYFAFYRSDLK